MNIMKRCDTKVKHSIVFKTRHGIEYIIHNQTTSDIILKIEKHTWSEIWNQIVNPMDIISLHIKYI